MRERKTWWTGNKLKSLATKLPIRTVLLKVTTSAAEIDLHLVKTVPGNPTKNWVPAYHFNMALKGSDTPIGVSPLHRP